MSSESAHTPLLPTEKLDPMAQDFNQSSRTSSSRKRRLRRSRSAPRGDCMYNDDVKIEEPPPHPSKIPMFSDLNPNLRRVIMLLALYLTIGTICFYLVRNQISGQKTNGVLDAIYFCIVTMTTVGYGDLVPNSSASRLLACAFVFSGMVLVGHLLSRAADYLVEKQETLLVRAFHLRQTFGPTDILKELHTNKLRYKCYVTFLVLVVLFLVGTTFLVMVEKMPVIEAFYCVCSTVTTLGYGDKSFSSGTGRLFAVFWILTSTICLAQFFLYVAELNAENKQRALVNWVLTRRITNNDLEAADLDEDGLVGAAEFILYKLKEMGKINEKDISGIMEEFEQLDYDDSGTLTTSDIVLAQTTSLNQR
ncbi:Two-pore potassium channel 1 [Cardamine amara subsp. amara]|uniref:Two-pore potassium channel 1 n=1 Tax=Cardamine amara subsp. amara TaxID=228776 RepID=A0ABD1A146_CARAN